MKNIIIKSVNISFGLFCILFLLLSSAIAITIDHQSIERTGSFIPNIQNVKYPTTNNLCTYDDISMNIEAGINCIKSEEIAIQFANQFEKILTQGKENKRSWLVSKLKDIGNTKTGDKRYLFIRLSNEIAVRGYINQSMVKCSSFSGILNDSLGISFEFFQKDKVCNITMIQSYGSMYLETRYVVDMNYLFKEVSNLNLNTTNESIINSLIHNLTRVSQTSLSMGVKQFINYKLQQHLFSQKRMASVLENYASLQQLATVVNTYRGEKGTLPDSLIQNDVKNYMRNMPVNKLSSSVCGKVKYEDLYFKDKSKQNYILISPTYKTSEIGIDYIYGSDKYFIGDPTIFFDNCMKIKRDMFDKKENGTYKYEDYSCAKDIAKCKSTDYITVIFTSK